MDERTDDLISTTKQIIRDSKRLKRELKQTIAEMKAVREPPKKRKRK
jgi:hypothetical protein